MVLSFALVSDLFFFWKLITNHLDLALFNLSLQPKLKVGGTGALGFFFIGFAGAPGVVSHYYLIVESIYKGDFLSANSFSTETFLKQLKCTKTCCI